MRLEIPVNDVRDLFIKYLLSINFLLKLREDTEIPILASFLVLYNKYKDYNKNTLNSLLFSDRTKQMIREGLKMHPKAFNHAMRQLVEKRIFESEKGRIIEKILYPIFTGDYEIKITFKEFKRESNTTAVQEVQSPESNNTGDLPIPLSNLEEKTTGRKFGGDASSVIREVHSETRYEKAGGNLPRSSEKIKRGTKS